MDEQSGESEKEEVMGEGRWVCNEPVLEWRWRRDL